MAPQTLIISGSLDGTCDLNTVNMNAKNATTSTASTARLMGEVCFVSGWAMPRRKAHNLLLVHGILIGRGPKKACKIRPMN